MKQSARSARNVYQPRTPSYEWGGPVGAAGMVLMLPFIVFSLNAMCDESSCSLPSALSDVIEKYARTVIHSLEHLPEALAIEGLWMVFHSLFYLLPVGELVEGTPLRDGTILRYRMNAIHALVVSHGGLFLLHAAGLIDLCSLCELFPALMVASFIISGAMSVVLYAASLRSDTVLTAEGGNSGNVFYDFWVGRELNPRWGFLDWKFMCELRPGLIGWSVINWAFVLYSWKMQTFTPSILLIAIFQSGYVIDGLLLEKGNLTMMDITTDGFGFMLCFGDLTWVPFTYTLQAKYLASHPVYLHPAALLFCTLLVVVGYLIFRGANTEKNRFRSNPSDPRVAHLKVMKTSKGKSLIISGYWGICRHPNYVGDWLMSVGWAALTGNVALLPYFHPIYFGSLLMHRQLRDEQQMKEKYGAADWRKFCSIVRYRLIPGVY